MWEREFLIWLHAHSKPLLDQVVLSTQWLGTTLFFFILVTLAAVWHLVHKQRREALV